jgi:hypothetical protein
VGQLIDFLLYCIMYATNLIIVAKGRDYVYGTVATNRPFAQPLYDA